MTVAARRPRASSRRRTVTGPTATVVDNFNRTSTTSPGTAQTGQVWRAESGTWGTDGAAIYSVTAADGNQVTIDCGSQTQDITVTLAVGAGANKYPFALARWSGIDSFYVLWIDPDRHVRIESWPAFTVKGTPTAAGLITDGDILRFRVVEETTPTPGTRLTVWRNGTQIINTLDTAGARPSGTRMGFRHGSDSGVQVIKWDDLTVQTA